MKHYVFAGEDSWFVSNSAPDSRPIRPVPGTRVDLRFWTPTSTHDRRAEVSGKASRAGFIRTRIAEYEAHSYYSVTQDCGAAGWAEIGTFSDIEKARKFARSAARSRGIRVVVDKIEREGLE